YTKRGRFRRSFPFVPAEGNQEIHMKHIGTTALAATLCATAFSQPGLAQVPPASVLRIDTVNAVGYAEDTADVSKFATDPNVTTAATPRNFNRVVALADIQA